MANLENETDFEDVIDSTEEVVEEEVENVDEAEEGWSASNKKDKARREKVMKDTNDGKDRPVKEETIAAASLKTHASADKSNAPGDDKAVTSSKVAMMKNMTHMMAGMDKTDLLDFFNKTMAQFGPGKDYGVGDNSGSNQSSIDTTLGKGPKTKDAMPKLDSKNHWAEDVEAMFSGQDLSEEFKEKVETIFEAAISAHVITETVRLEEEFEAKLAEEVEVIKEELSAKLDTYLDYVVENWMKENEVAVESTLRNEIMEEFIDGLKGLFAEHYIDIPEDKVDVLAALAEKVDVLEKKLDEEITKNVALEEAMIEEARKDIFEEISSDLALTQQEKFAALAEGIEFTGDLDTYTKKLMIVKENYFKAPTAPSSNITEETFEGDVTDNVVSVDPSVNRYVQAIARTVKK